MSGQRLSPALVRAIRAFGEETGLARESNHTDPRTNYVYWQSARSLEKLGLARLEGVRHSGTWWELTQAGEELRATLPVIEQQRLFA